MTETSTRLFWGDDEREDEHPQDFLNSIERLFIQKSNATDAQRLRAFQLYLKSGSVAKQWWNDLPTSDKDTWEHLVQAFEKRWPDKATTVKTVEEKQAALERTKITEEEVGKRVKNNGVEEFAHVVWADKIERLAAAIPDTNGLLIGNVRKTMPKVLQKVTGLGHTDWTTFCKAIRTATLSQIDEAKEEEREARHIREELKKLQGLRNTSTRDLTSAFQRLNVGTSTNPAPRFPILRNQPAHTINQAHPQTYRTNNTFPTNAAQPAGEQTSYRANRPPEVRLADITRLALPIQPNTPVGRAAYDRQIVDWNSANPGQTVSEFRPYPLVPGTNPVASGECWKCGMVGHMGRNCDNPVQVPALEQRWRSIAATIKRSCGTTTSDSININFVGSDQQWLTKEEYDQQVIANFLADQGKGQGSSA